MEADSAGVLMGGQWGSVSFVPLCLCGEIVRLWSWLVPIPILLTTKAQRHKGRSTEEEIVLGLGFQYKKRFEPISVN
jgi:hypothetical protein